MNNYIFLFSISLIMQTFFTTSKLFSAKKPVALLNLSNKRINFSSLRNSIKLDSPLTAPTQTPRTHDELTQEFLGIPLSNSDPAINTENINKIIFDKIHIAINKKDFACWNSIIPNTNPTSLFSQQENEHINDIYLYKKTINRLWIQPRNIIDDFATFSEMSCALLLEHNLVILGMVKESTSQLITIDYESKEVISRINLPQNHNISKLIYIPKKHLVIAVSNCPDQRSSMTYLTLEYNSTRNNYLLNTEPKDLKTYPSITSIAVSADQEALFFSSEKFIYKISTNQTNNIQRIKLDCNNYTITSLCLSPNGKHLFAQVNYNDSNTESRILMFEITDKSINYKESWCALSIDPQIAMFSDLSGERLCWLYKGTTGPYIKTLNLSSKENKKIDISLEDALWWICTPFCNEFLEASPEEQSCNNDVLIIVGKDHNYSIRFSFLQI